jgi:hypothetical protein
MPTPTRTYPGTDRQRVLNFVQSLEISENQQPYVSEIFKKSSFSARDLKILLQIVASRAQISSVQLATLGLPSLPHSVREETTR